MYSLYRLLIPGIPAGPYTQQDGIWGYLEILQAFNNETLPWLPGATPKSWEVVVDDCYDAPYACKYFFILITQKFHSVIIAYDIMILIVL